MLARDICPGLQQFESNNRNTMHVQESHRESAGRHVEVYIRPGRTHGLRRRRTDNATLQAHDCKCRGRVSQSAVLHKHSESAFVECELFYKLYNCVGEGTMLSDRADSPERKRFDIIFGFL